MSSIIDDKTEHCIPFLLKCLGRRLENHGQEKPTPFFLGLNGVQGAGKTTLVWHSQVPGKLARPSSWTKFEASGFVITRELDVLLEEARLGFTELMTSGRPFQSSTSSNLHHKSWF